MRRSGEWGWHDFLVPAARVSGEGVSPDALLSGYVCMSSAASLGRVGAGLGRALVDGVAPVNRRCVLGTPVGTHPGFHTCMNQILVQKMLFGPFALSRLTIL